MKKNIFITMFLLSATSLFAQNIAVRHNILQAEVDTVYKRYDVLKLKTIVPENAVSINLGGGVPVMFNSSPKKQDFWNRKSGVGLIFGIDYKHHFFTSQIANNKVIKKPSMFGLGVGLGISRLSQSAIMDGDNKYTEHLEHFTDRDGDSAIVTLSYKGFKENISFTCLDIPLYLEIGKPSQVKLSGYCNIGIKASIRIAGEYKKEGTYTSEGFYKTINGEDVNVTIRDVGELEYYTDKPVSEKHKLSPFVLWGCLSGGINIPLRGIEKTLEKNNYGNWILRIGAKADFTILPVSISPKIAEPYFKKTIFYTNQSNILGGNSGYVFLPSVEVKLIYCIN